MICSRAQMTIGKLFAMTFTLRVRLKFSFSTLYNIDNQGKYVYISPATSFLKGRVKGHWYRGKEVSESLMFRTQSLVSRYVSGDLGSVPVCGPCHQQEVASQ